MSYSQVYNNMATSGANVYRDIIVGGENDQDMCTFGMSLTGVFPIGSVRTCESPPPPMLPATLPSPPGPQPPLPPFPPAPLPPPFSPMLPGGGFLVQSGRDTLQAAHDVVSDGGELVLGDGTYTDSGNEVLRVSKSITIRALHPGAAVLDGENVRWVVRLRHAGTVTLHGLNITRGYSPTGAGLHVGPGSTALVTATSIYACAVTNVVRQSPHI